LKFKSVMTWQDSDYSSLETRIRHALASHFGFRSIGRKDAANNQDLLAFHSSTPCSALLFIIGFLSKNVLFILSLQGADLASSEIPERLLRRCGHGKGTAVAAASGQPGLP
jgi:hypothetical protein